MYFLKEVINLQSVYHELKLGGIYWTKFECILLIILIPTNRTRGARGGLKFNRTLQSARLARSLRSRERKPKIFLTFHVFFGGGCGGSRQKMERKFLVLLRR